MDPHTVHTANQIARNFACMNTSPKGGGGLHELVIEAEKRLK